MIFYSKAKIISILQSANGLCLHKDESGQRNHISSHAKVLWDTIKARESWLL